jgi:hypothetical protein
MVRAKLEFGLMGGGAHQVGARLSAAGHPVLHALELALQAQARKQVVVVAQAIEAAHA